MEGTAMTNQEKRSLGTYTEIFKDWPYHYVKEMVKGLLQATLSVHFLPR